MSNVAIEKVRDANVLPASLLDRVKTTAEKIQRRAFELFQNRSDVGDRSVEDWLQAEREIMLSPESELIEKDGKFRMRMAVPGFHANDIHVTAIPGAVIVDAKAEHTHEKSEGDVYFSEFGQKQLYRRLDLPAPINPDKVTANLEKGVLELTAEKAVDAANKVKAIAAS